jgi:2-C-methyl-D-erythritol 2,4-cyclodiphosphate synthase
MGRVGLGYDVHPLVLGRRLVIGGVEIPFEKGLSGHSDADVLIHAIADSLLGAAGLRDIGTHFPPDDSRYACVSSLILLQEVGKLLRDKGVVVCNIDAVIVAEQPKLSAFIDEMRIQISRALGVDVSQVMVKATTSEGLGFVGKGEGIAAYAVSMVTEK